MDRQINIASSIRQTLSLLGTRPLHTLGTMAFISALSTGLPYLFGEVAELGVSIGLNIVSCYVYLAVTAFLITDSGYLGSDQARLMQNAQSKFIWYFLFTIIAAIAAGIIASIPGVIGILVLLADPVVLENFATDPDNVLLDVFQNGTPTLIIIGLVAVLLVNLLLALWFIVPAVMVARNQGIAAMGTSARLVRVHFGRIYFLSLIAIFINGFLTLVPIWLVLTGQMADNVINNALIGIPQGIGYAFMLSLSVVVWQQLDEEADKVSVFS